MSAQTPELTARLQERFGAGVLEAHAQAGDETVVVAAGVVHDVLAYLKEEAAFNYLMDVTTVDYLTYPTPKRERFEVVYHLFSLSARRRIRVKAPVALGGSVPTATDLWAGADWFEREAWEMYGVAFAGHPNLKRLMTHVEFVGHPLRKDYPLKKRQPLSEADSLMDEMEARLKLKGLK